MRAMCDNPSKPLAKARRALTCFHRCSYERGQDRAAIGQTGKAVSRMGMCWLEGIGGHGRLHLHWNQVDGVLNS